MAIYAITKENIVIALVQATQAFATANGWEAKGIIQVTNGVQIGDFYIDGKFFKCLSDGFITKTEFLSLFSMNERRQLISLRDRHNIFQELFDYIESREASSINIKAPRMQAAIDYMVGIIDGFDATRAAEVKTGTHN